MEKTEIGRLQQDFQKKENRESVRLNKYLSEAGICSRREADRLIEKGIVKIDGKMAETGSRVFAGQTVKVNGKAVKQEPEMILLAFYKPRGIVCTTDKTHGEKTVDDVLQCKKRVFYVGRLDKDSEGLLLMTNNGEVVNKIMRAGNHHEKEYVVTVDKEVNGDFCKKMSLGVPILDTVTRPCVIKKIGKYQFRIVLTQGLNRQIRRMCEYLGYRVTSLVRVRIMNVKLGDLKPGQHRALSVQEENQLFDQIKDSYANPKKGGRQNGKSSRKNERTGRNSDKSR